MDTLHLVEMTLFPSMPLPIMSYFFLGLVENIFCGEKVCDIVLCISNLIRYFLQDFFRPVNLLSEQQFSDVNIEFGTELEQSAADEEVDNINSDPFNDGDDVEPMG